MKFLVISNCLGESIAQILRAGQIHSAEHLVVHTISPDILTPQYLAGFDAVIAQDIRPDLQDLWQAINTHPQVIRFPWLLFYGFTPDFSTLQSAPGTAGRPLSNIPRIMAGAKLRGLSPEQTRALYNPEFIDAMGYRRDFATNRDIFVKNLSLYTARASYLFEKWFARGVFFFMANHPKSFVIEDILRDILANYDIDMPTFQVSDFLTDPLAKHAILPNLNHPAASNLLDHADHVYKVNFSVVGLGTHITDTFNLIDKSQGRVQLSKRDQERFDTAWQAWNSRTPKPMSNPYSNRPAHSFWSKAVARPTPQKIRPGAHLRPVIATDTRVATAGSCFAQHVARAMVSDGLNYYVAEPAPKDMPEEVAQTQGYGLFSARFGNIYSTRQLLQLFQRAYGSFSPIETAWKVEGGFIDPFRPNIGEVFATVEALEAARDSHLKAVRTMFETLDVFVFTLGLSEGWIDRRDGAAFPVTPGAVTKLADPDHFTFLNLDHGAIKADLTDFLEHLLRVNPKAQVIFTISPVPLIATYSETDALTATTYSKSVLRVAAGELADQFDAVQYFPSYEIITGAFNRGAYFEDDLRNVRPEGVAHVMDVFRERLVIGSQKEPDTRVEESATAHSEQSRKDFVDEMARQMHVVCDEELLIEE